MALLRDNTDNKGAMPVQPLVRSRKPTDGPTTDTPFRDTRLRKHADYQRVYREGKRQSLPLMTYFFAPRQLETSADPAKITSESRVGLTAGRVLGNAVERNRIKRRMRAAVRQHRGELTASVDVILHPRRAVLEAEFAQIEREVLRAFRAVQNAAPAKIPDATSLHEH